MIGPENHFALIAVLAGLACFGFWIDTTSVGRKLSGVVWVITLGILLANVGVVPLDAPLYGFVGGTLMPLAIPMLLLKADLRRIISGSGRVLIAFAVATAATVLGAVLGYWLFDLGDMGARVAGTYAAGWIGGAVNFVAVSEMLGMQPEEFSVAISASSPVSVIALICLVGMPSLGWLSRHLPSRYGTDDVTDGDIRVELDAMPLIHTVAVFAISASICAVASIIAAYFAIPHFHLLFVTLLSLVVANVAPQPMSRMRGDFTLGMLIMFVFFAMIGCSTNATAFLGHALVLFFYGLSIIAVHLVVVTLVGRLLKLDLAEIVIASAAAMVGPAPAAAIASAQRWGTLVTPALMCGILGYAVANFIGLALGTVLGAQP